MTLLSALRGRLSRLVKKKPTGIEYDYCYEAPGLNNVLVITEHVNATYYLSFHYVFESLHEKGLLNFYVLSQSSVANNVGRLGVECFINTLMEIRPKTVIFTRYAKPYAKELLEAAKSIGAEVIYHIDDDLLSIPESLGKAVNKTHGSSDVISSRRHLLANADKIYPSTKALMEKLSTEFDAPMDTGMYAPYLKGVLDLERLDGNSKREVVIGYMGSRGHQEDFEIVSPAIERLLGEQDTVRFEMFGTIAMPDSLKVFGDRVRHHKVNSNYAGFLAKLNALNWDIGLAPLADNKFNRCKANTKFVEYTACGIATVASNVSVYADVLQNGRGVLCTDDEWFDALLGLVISRESVEGLVIAADNFCKREFAVSRLEKQVTDIIGYGAPR